MFQMSLVTTVKKKHNINQQNFCVGVILRHQLAAHRRQVSIPHQIVSQSVNPGKYSCSPQTRQQKVTFDRYHLYLRG